MVKVHRSLSVSLFYVLLWVGAGSLVAASAIGKDWKIRDAFDEVRVKMEKINPDNCSISDKDNLYLPDDSVSHHPDVKGIDINPILPNRTALLQLYNMALNRAFFWSYILQSRFIKPAINDTYDPGMMYYFLSSVADVSSNPYINASSIYFSPNMSYTSSYRGFFNKTMPRFAPRAWRADINLVHQQKIPTLLHVEDLGAFEAESLTKDYTSEFYRINEWYKRWLPDNAEKSRDTKTTYQVEIRYVNNTNETFTFYGPPGNYDVQVPDPVKWTRPYYDCGRQNKWLVAAVSPVADIFPRHTHSIPDIEYPTYTAAVVMELDYNKIDINQCPPSQGNDQPNRFASTARCKENTECEPLYGWGFRRGGYQCRCAPGRRLPSIVRRPYLGEVIERAISDQYYNNFDCNEIIDESHTQSDKEHPLLRANYTDNSTSGPDAVQPEKLNEALKFMRAVQPHNCAKYHPKELFLNVDIAKGAEEQLGIQANMALRLANFISAFLQVSDPREVFSGNRVADKPLSEDQMFGETLAVVLGDSKIRAAGTFWDRNKFTNRAFFAPFAYKQESNTRKFKLEDLARLNKTEELYTNKPWFHILKQRWSINYDSLEKIFLKMKIRDDEAGKYLKKYERYPTFYRAANLKHGHWTRPYFDCDGHLKQWVITYAAPFFGWDNAKVKLEFKGVVAVTMSLTSLDINQCPDKYYVPNAFKGTDKCDRSSFYADQVQTPASGGGEGAPAVAKPETAVAPPKVEAPEDVKPEVKPDEYKEVKPLPTEVQPAPPVVQTEQPKEVKLEEPKEVKTEVPPVPESKVEATQETKVEATQETKVEATQETKVEATQETKVEATQETKVEATQETKVEATQEVSKPANGVESIAASKDEDDWQQRECELLKKINELEKVKKERTQDSYLLELKVREEEIDLLKARVKNLETELQAALSKPSGKNHEMIENIKQQHEELLSKARGMIFDKTKMVKNQELQIEALTSQIQSLKDINQITKDLLEIRNSEIKAMEDRLHAMEARFKAEKDRYGLVLQRAQTSSNINDDLRKEYETQLVLFKELREKYDQRVQALVAENERLKASLAPANGAGTSG